MKRFIILFLLIPSACFTTVWKVDWRIMDAMEAKKEQGYKIDLKCFKKQCECFETEKDCYWYIVCQKYNLALPFLNDNEEREPCNK